MFLAPNKPSKVAEPGLFASGGVSSTAPAAPVQAVSPSPQWTASPMNADARNSDRATDDAAADRLG
jgi:hypothetical protein